MSEKIKNKKKSKSSSSSPQKEDIMEEEKKTPTIVDLGGDAPKVFVKHAEFAKPVKKQAESASDLDSKPEAMKESSTQSITSEQQDIHTDSLLRPSSDAQVSSSSDSLLRPSSDGQVSSSSDSLLRPSSDGQVSSSSDAQVSLSSDAQVKPSYYAEYEEPCVDSPLFKQIYNGCGFSSMLVLMDPIKNQNLSQLFDTLWNQIRKILTLKIPAQKELQWSYVLEYLLLKLNTDGLLSEYLYDILLDDFDISRALLNDRLTAFQTGHEQNDRSIFADAYKLYFEQGIVNPVIIDQHIRLMKENWELKPLFALFGYQLNHQYPPIGSSDGLGAIFFDRKDLQNPLNDEVSHRIEMVKTEFEKGARIIYAIKDHWMPVTNIVKNEKGYFLTFNDSYKSQKYTVALTKLMNSNWFYIFKKQKDWQSQSNTVMTKLVDWTHSEIDKDGKAFIEFQRRIQEHMKQQGQKPGGKLEIKLTTEVVTEETAAESQSQQIGGVKITSEILDLSSSQPVQEKNLEPMSGDAFKDYIKQIIRSKFSDYDKM
jgi:hypothetical protein